jgi:hypothetical protein
MFWFKLARALGMSVRRCMDEIDSAELSEWMAFDQLDPIGQDREDLRMGILASTIVSAAHPKSKCRPLDFMPDFAGKRKGKVRKQTASEIESVLAGSVIVKTRKK